MAPETCNFLCDVKFSSDQIGVADLVTFSKSKTFLHVQSPAIFDRSLTQDQFIVFVLFFSFNLQQKYLSCFSTPLPPPPPHHVFHRADLLAPGFRQPPWPGGVHADLW